MSSLRTIALALLIVALPSASFAAKSFPGKGFKRVLNKKGVVVYKNDSSSFVHMAADAIIKAKPAVVQKALLQYEQQVGKVPRLSEAKILEKGKTSLRVYQRLALPVIDDRDFILQVKWGGGDKRRWVSFRTTDKGPSPRKGIVRVSYNVGKWQLTPVHNGHHTRLRLVNGIDIAGDIPSWAAKSGGADDIPELYEAICRLSRSYTGSKSCLTH
jgi:hypothetical protein